jgi:hypothetical protein
VSTSPALWSKGRDISGLLTALREFKINEPMIR